MIHKKKKIISSLTVIVFCGVVFLTGCAQKEKEQTQVQEKIQAQNGAANNNEDATHNRVVGEERKGNGGMRPEMSQEAVGACVDKNIDDACEMTMTDPEGAQRTMIGTCQMQSGDTEVRACVPDRGQNGDLRSTQDPDHAIN